MAYYSFVVKSPRPMALENPTVYLDEGVNPFTAVLDGSEDEVALDKFLARLKDEGVEVIQTNRLDKFEEGSSSDLVLPGESLDKLLG